jgi:hypothetical protein
MAIRRGGRDGDGEEAPLLTGERLHRDVRREGAVVLEGGDAVDENKANQQVGRGRGFLIILSLYGLIFLQGWLCASG